MTPEAFEQLKGLEWQVSLRHQDLYYQGRGGTPVKALEDLSQSLAVGIKHAEEQLEASTRRAENLMSALAEVQEERVFPPDKRDDA